MPIGHQSIRERWGTKELCGSTRSSPLPKATPDGDDEGMTDTTPSHRNPARWLRYRAMAAHGRYRRVMGLALASGPLLVAGVVWASPAQADAASYLNDVHNVGIRDVGGDAALLQMGQKMCDETWYGWPPDRLAAMALQRSDTIRGAHGLTPQQANEFVYYAKADLCPNY
jgi:Protein of unknown function (DUF732)